MKEVFKELITDFHKKALPDLVFRDIKLPDLPENVRKVFVFIGMRRSGKTYTLYQIMKELIAKGLEFSKILYINFEDERICDMKKENFQDIILAYFELYPQYLNRQDIHFFFDEIHEIAVWEKFIRRLLDQEKMTIYVTGSSCKLLSKEIASSLRGRSWSQEIFPFAFNEYLRKFNITTFNKYSTRSKIEVAHNLENFLKWGGFPEVIGASPDMHRSVIQGYMSSVIYRDIINRYGISNSHSLNLLLSHCLRNSARVFSINKMYNALKSMNYEVSRSTLYDYMEYFEDAYCVFSLDKFDLSHRKSTHSMKKVFAVDQGLITAVSMDSSFDLSAQLETAVFSYLRRKSQSIFYYKTQNDKEIDFLILYPDQNIALFQVCLNLKNASTYKREVDALTLAMQELKLSEGTIVTLDEEREVETKIGKIFIVPVSKLFLT